ncbi:MAG: tetratricopeptide repeat protein [Myxococcota bacterium]
MTRLLGMSALVLGVVFGAASGAHAQDEANRARLHFQAGASYYEAGDYEDALREFQRSYDLSQRPELFYNFSLCYQQLGQLDQAIVYLDRYLTEVEDVPNRANLERRLVNFRARQAEEVRRAEAEAAAERAAAEEPPDEAREPVAEPAETGLAATAEAADEEDAGGVNGAAIAGFAIAGAGVVVLGVAGGLALAQRSDLEDQACAPDCASGDVDTLRTRAIVADVGLAVALVGATLGVVFLLTGGDDDDESAEATAWGVTPWVGPRSGGAAVGGRF